MNEIFDHLKKYFLIYLEGLLQIFGIIIGLFSSEVFFWIREESWVKLSVFGSFIVFFIVINIYKVIAEKKLVALNNNDRNCFSKMLNGVINFFESREDHTLIRDITSFFLYYS